MPNRTRSSYDAVASHYADRFSEELEAKPFDRQLLDAVAGRLAGQGPVVDLGCGPGHLAAYLHERGVDALGVDLSPGMLTQARARHPRLEFREADMRGLPFEDGSLAGVVAFYSIIHIPREQVPAVLSELRRVLRPGGILLLAFHLGEDTVHLDDWWDEPVDVDFFFFEREQMEGWLQDAGFALEEARERDPYPDVEGQTRRAYLLSRAPA